MKRSGKARSPVVAKSAQAFVAPTTPIEPAEDVHPRNAGFAQDIIDALSVHLCVLDGAGKILAVNRAWREFAAANLPAGRNIAAGASYLAECDAAARPGADVAGAFAAGIRAVLRGERLEFSLEYPCHSQSEPRWFSGRVARFAGAGPVRVVVTHEDITARRQAEAALQASEVELRAIVENTADLECWFNPDGTLRWVNPAVENITGYTVAESFAMAGFPLPLFAVEDAARGAAGFRAAVAGSRGHDFEVSLVRKDGACRWVSVSWQPICARDGTSLGHRASVRDITERKQAELALAELEERYRTVVEDQTEAISRFQADGIITFVNEVYCRFFGKRRHELVGHKWHPLVFAEDLPHVEERLREMSPAIPIVAIENRVYSGTGEVRWMQFVNRGFYDASGRLLEIQAVGRDVTPRKQVEIALRESEERYRLLVENSGLGVGYYRTDGTILYFNKVWVEALAGEREDFIGRSVVDVFGQRNGKKYLCRFRMVAAREQPMEFVDTVTLPTGRASFLSCYGRVVDATGKVKGIQVVATDITARKRAEEELRASREELRALAARLQAVREEERTEVAREIHDVLAQELTRLKIDLVWLQRRLLKANGAGAGAGLANRVAEMIQVADTTIHAVQRIATGLRPAVLDSLGLCAAIEWQVRDFQAHAGIECQVRVPEVEPALSREAATAAFRIFQEGLTNVLRHARATRVEIALRQDGGQLLLAIKDNGVGAQPGALSNPMSFGLVGMRERALILGGRLEIQSQSGAGTTIEVRLPLAGKGGAAAS